MKYWIFQNNQVCGPYDPDALSQLPGYSAESLVCPEGRKGASMGDWQRAGSVPELPISLAQSTQPSAPGSLQEKVALIESTVARFQEGLQAKETELLSLHRESDVHKGIEADLHGKIQELEKQLAAVAKLRETIENAVAAEKTVETEVKGVETAVHSVESSVQEVKSSMTGVSATVKDLESALDKQRQTITDLMAEIERLKSGRAAPKGAPSPEGGPETPPFQFNPPPAFAPYGAGPETAPPPLLEPAPLNAPPPGPFFPGQAEAAAAPPLADGPATAPKPADQPAGSPFEFAIPPAAPPSDRKAAAPEPAVVDLVPAPPQPRKAGPVLALVGFALVAGGVLAFRAGLIPALKTPAKPAAPADTTLPPPSAPPAKPAPPAPSPEAQLEELKRRAIELVQSWPTSDKTVSVGQSLAAAAPHSEGLSPWLAEKLKDDAFQVNFYGAKPAAGKQVVYEFQASLPDKAVTPLNAAAKALLLGEPAARRSRKKVGVKPKKAHTPKPAASPLDSPLGLGPGPGPAGGPIAEPAEGGPAPAPMKPADAKPAKGGDDAQALDDLLQP